MTRIFSVVTGFLWKEIVSKFRAPKGTVLMGQYTYGKPIVISFLDEDKVIIGKFCSIADDVIIIASGEHRYDRVSTFPFRSRFLEKKEKDSCTKGPVIIGNDVWMGSRVTILSGVRIGDGAVIGTGAVVTDNVPPYAIVTGVPAKVKRFRFSEPEIKKLIQIAWWNWSLQKILKNIDYFYGDPKDFISKFSEQETDKTQLG